jgi:hypothetical protein
MGPNRNPRWSESTLRVTLSYLRVVVNRTHYTRLSMEKCAYDVLLYTYHVIKQCTEKETTSLSNFLLTIQLNYLHDLKIMFQCLLHLNMYM